MTLWLVPARSSQALPEEDAMSSVRTQTARWPLIVTFSFILAALPASPVWAQFLGYGYGYPSYGFGYGYGWPGYGGAYDYGYPGLGYGYGLGYGGYPAFGGAYSFGAPGPSYVTPYAPLGIYNGGPGPGVYNPLFGVGLSPLGVNSALAERYTLGRGVARSQNVYGTVPPATVAPAPATAPSPAGR
jgi:hypothetical protein